MVVWYTVAILKNLTTQEMTISETVIMVFLASLTILLWESAINAHDD